MAVATLIGSDVDLATQVQWATRLAAAREESLLLLIPVLTEGDERVAKIELHAAPEDDEPGAVRKIRALVDSSPLLRIAGDNDDPPPEEQEDAPRTVPTRVKALHCKSLDRGVGKLLLAEIRKGKIKLLVTVRKQYDSADPKLESARRQFLRRSPCEVVYLCVGATEVESVSRILVPAARGPHNKAALDLALKLAARDDGQVTALRVNPDIGEDAAAVGEHALERIVKRALGKEHKNVERKVVVAGQVIQGIRQACDEMSPDLVVVGTTKRGALGQQFRGTVASKLLRGKISAPIAVVHAATPITNRAGQFVERTIQRIVPQLERESRIDLVERIQGNSQWDFDFFALMSLSTFIAALGLVQNSAAVVIGAMLVAPLMTPLLGLGIAIVQGNPVFARIAARSVGLGFLVAFCIGVGVGWLDVSFTEPTPEILARGWPGLLDLFVAFAAGFAAAYASCRPGLLAALPGVAIAAALVPPIGASGLALALGEYRLAWGALLLFLVNMVTIVFASTIALWVVGIRNVKKGSRLTLVARGAMVVAVLGLAVQLSLSPPKYSFESTISPELVEAVEQRLGSSHRLYGLDVSHSERGVELIVRVRGRQLVPDELADEVRAIAGEHFDEAVQVRLVTRFEIGADE